MLFAVWARDAAGMQGAREQVRARHRARLRQPDPHPVKVVLAGPTFDGNARMCGTMLVIEAETIDAVRAFIAGDPYVTAGVYESYEIRPWKCGLGPLASAQTEG
ncbi:MAG: YciI family protein [Proteobacteria bacterium]|nr:YciI family protein [Pseudomonadota bacterium]